MASPGCTEREKVKEEEGGWAFGRSDGGALVSIVMATCCLHPPVCTVWKYTVHSCTAFHARVVWYQWNGNTGMVEWNSGVVEWNTGMKDWNGNFTKSRTKARARGIKWQAELPGSQNHHSSILSHNSIPLIPSIPHN